MISTTSSARVHVEMLLSPGNRISIRLNSQSVANLRPILTSFENRQEEVYSDLENALVGKASAKLLQNLESHVEADKIRC